MLVVSHLLSLSNRLLALRLLSVLLQLLQLEAAKQQLQEAYSCIDSSLPAMPSAADDATRRCDMGQAPSPTPPAGSDYASSIPACRTDDSQLAGSTARGSHEPYSCASTPCASAAASPMASQAEGAAAGGGAGSSPRLGEQLSALSPFAKARGFMAHRVAEAMARLKVGLMHRWGTALLSAVM
jgi:hypothetical protein